MMSILFQKPPIKIYALKMARRYSIFDSPLASFNVEIRSFIFVEICLYAWQSTGDCLVPVPRDIAVYANEHKENGKRTKSEMVSQLFSALAVNHLHFYFYLSTSHKSAYFKRFQS